MAQLLELYSAACDMFIRPQRMQYPVEALGPRCFLRAGVKYVREDLELTNSRGLRLQCSHFYQHGARERAMVAQGVDGLSVRQLKHLLALARVSCAGCLEKADLLARVRKAYHLDGLLSSRGNERDIESERERARARERESERESERERERERKRENSKEGSVGERQRGKEEEEREGKVAEALRKSERGKGKGKGKESDARANSDNSDKPSAGEERAREGGREVEDGRMPCVVYLHGNCGCRMDAVDTLPMLLSLGFSLFCLDLSGSGLSEGEYISLGHFEQQDVEAAVKYLQKCEFVSSIALWGRSMGAATSILYAASHPEEISCLVLDSPFSSLAILAQEVVGSMELSVPSWLLNGALSVAMSFVRKSIRQKADFELYDVTPLDHVHKCQVPAIFIHGESDTFVAPSHSLRLYEAYGNEKAREIVLVRGDHNTTRPLPAQQYIAQMLWRALLPEHAKTGALAHGPVPIFGRTEVTKGLPCFLGKQIRGFDENSTWPSNAVLCFTETSIRIVEPYTEVLTHEFCYNRIAEVYTLDGDAFVFKVPGHVDIDMAKEGNRSGLVCFLLPDGALEAMQAFKTIAQASVVEQPKT